MDDRKFDGVWIPREIWLDERLSALDKVILVEIHSLDNGEEHCHAGNDYLAEFCQCSTSKVSKAVSKLIELGFIKVFSFDGRVRRLQSCLGFCTQQSSKICEAAEHNMLPININNNIDNKSISRRRSNRKTYSDGFDEFYSVYPRSIAKNPALKAWEKLKPDDSLKHIIITDVKKRIDGEWKGREERFIPYPSTYLNSRPWEDEPTEPKQSSNDDDPTMGPYGVWKY